MIILCMLNYDELEIVGELPKNKGHQNSQNVLINFRSDTNTVYIINYQFLN